MAVFVTTLIVLSLIGIIDTIYLAWKHLKKQPLVCPINEHDCNAVVESKYGKIFGIRNEYLGFVFYLLVLVSGVLLAYTKFKITPYLIILSIIALGASSYLTYIQSKVLRKYCFYCLISAFINLLIFLNVIALYLG